jgi:phosphoribosyl 1,2-cyclic phosphate phosphodiesterase
LRVTFLGTGTSHGVPMIGCTCPTCLSTDLRDSRLRPSVYLETDRTGVLVDAGPDLRQQALRHTIRRVDAILFTHGHADHILGMDDVRQFNAMQRGAMPCYGDPQTLEDIRRMFGYVFDPATPKGGGLPRLELFTLVGAFCIGDLEVQPIPLFHGKRPILGFRCGGFAYLTDCSRIPEEAWPMLRDLDVVVVDALRVRPHPTHFSVSEAIDAAERIDAKETFFTHMCHDLKHAETCAALPARMTLAHDGLVLNLPS